MSVEYHRDEGAIRILSTLTEQMSINTQNLSNLLSDFDAKVHDAMNGKGSNTGVWTSAVNSNIAIYNGRASIGPAGTSPHSEAVLHIYDTLWSNTSTEDIGDASNELVLENDGDCGMTIRSAANSDAVISFARTGTGNHNVGQIVYSHTSDSMTFRTANLSAALTIDSQGHVTSNHHAIGTRLAVGVAGVHASFGFYNETNAYFNGQTEINDLLIVSGTAAGIKVGTGLLIDDAPPNYSGRIGFNRHPASGSYLSSNSHQRFQINGPGNQGDRLEFQNYNSGGTHLGSLYFTGGKFGIGESIPDRILHVKSGTTNVVAKFESTDQIAAIEFTDSGGSAEIGCDGSDVVLFPAGSEKFRVQNSTGYLVAQSASQVRLVLGSTGNSSNNTSNWIRGTGNELGLNSGGGNIGFEVGGTQRMAIRSSGGVAIGNNNAGYSSQILSVKSGTADNVFYGESTDAKCIMSVRDGDSTANIGFGATGNAHVFSQDGVEVARISTGSADKYPQNAPNGGIGGNGANLRLLGDDSEIRMANNIIHSDNSGVTKFTIRAAYGSYSSGAELSLDGGYISFNTGTSFTESMRLTGGTFLVGKSSANQTLAGLQVTGTDFMLYTNTSTDTGDRCLILNQQNRSSGNLLEFRTGNSNVGVISLNSSGNMVYGGTSDYRLKEKVNYVWSATAKLKQLRPCEFEWKSDKYDAVNQGFLAHEVADIVPQAVSGNKDGVDKEDNPSYQQLDNSALVPLLVKTIQELEARIATLEG